MPLLTNMFRLLSQPCGWSANNVGSTYQVCRAALSTGVRQVVLISTDKAVRPTNVMGASKRLAELVVQAHAALGCSTCFSMVLWECPWFVGLSSACFNSCRRWSNNPYSS